MKSDVWTEEVSDLRDPLAVDNSWAAVASMWSLAVKAAPKSSRSVTEPLCQHVPRERNYAETGLSILELQSIFPERLQKRLILFKTESQMLR